jgi:hypothetical protein
MAATLNLFSDWLISKKKSSPLKLLDQMNRNLVGSILDRSSVEIAHFEAIVIKHGRHRYIFFLIV